LIKSFRNLWLFKFFIYSYCICKKPTPEKSYEHLSE
jgi:hypothetical protein